MITKKSFTGLTAPHQQCELMDAASEQKRFPETDQVLAYDDFNLQTIFEYIQITLFKIDQFMLDKVWQSLRQGTWSLWTQVSLNGLVTIMKHLMR